MNYLAIKEEAENRILKVRGIEVMIDKDVADLYGISETAELNRKVKNNPDKFNSELYCFELNKEEKSILLEENPRLEMLKHSPNIRAYTEYGILMLATTFQKSNEVAIQICHVLVQTFIEYRKKNRSLINSDSIISEIKRDVELLKNFAISQHEKNGMIEEHYEMIFKELHQMKKATLAESKKGEIGFKMIKKEPDIE